MRGLVLLAFYLFSFSVLAAEHKNCDLSAAGFKRPKEFGKFFAKLQAAAAAKDSAALAKMASYPLRVGKERIKDESELKRKFSKVFTPKVLGAITGQKQSDLYCDYQGARIGKGEAWVQEIEGVIVISSINTIDK